MMVLFMGLLTAVAGYFRKNELLASLVKAPWERLSGMLQNGQWMSPEKSHHWHPSQHNRHVTIEGIKP